MGHTLRAQSSAVADTPLAFDVASVKPAASNVRSGVGRPVNGVVTTRAAELRRIIADAYGIDPVSHDPQPQGGPDWIDSELFEIQARGLAAMTWNEGRAMMRTLLKERFNLKVRVEKREVPVYALVVARKDGRLGPKLTASKTDCRAFSEALERTGRLAVAREISTDCDVVVIDSVERPTPN